MSSSQTFSVNEHAAGLVDRVKAAAAELKVSVARGDLGETLIDAGSRTRGSIAAGCAARRDLHGRAGNGDARFKHRDSALALDTRGSLVQSGDRLPRLPICRLAPLRWEGQGRVLRARLRPGAGACRDEALFEELSYQDNATTAHSSSRAAVLRRPLWLPRLRMTAVWHPIG